MTGISSKMNTIVSSLTMLRFIFLQAVPGENVCSSFAGYHLIKSLSLIRKIMRRQQISYPPADTPSVGRLYVWHISAINIKSGNEREHWAPRQLKLLNRKENNLMLLFFLGLR